MIESIKKNKKGIMLMLLSSLFVCVGQLFWKLSASGNMVYMLIGFGLYGMGALVMLYAYKFGSLSVLQPMLSANYIFTIVLAAAVLQEKITVFKIVGIIIIICGVILVGVGDSD